MPQAQVNRLRRELRTPAPCRGPKLCVECAGYTYNLVHVQTHSVPAPFTADVSTRPDRVAYDADGHAFDTNTKLDKEQARVRAQWPLCSVLRWRGRAASSRLLAACCPNVLLPTCCRRPGVAYLLRSQGLTGDVAARSPCVLCRWRLRSTF